MSAPSPLGLDIEALFFKNCAEKAKEMNPGGTGYFIIVDTTGQIIAEGAMPGSRTAQREAALAKARSVLSRNSISHLRPPSSFCGFRFLGVGSILCCAGMLCVMLGCRRESHVEGATILRYLNKGGPPGKVIVACSGSLDDGADLAVLEHALSSIRGMSKDLASKEWTWAPQDPPQY